VERTVRASIPQHERVAVYIDCRFCAPESMQSMGGAPLDRTLLLSVRAEVSKHEHVPGCPMIFWVYLLRCADGSYYTGHTDDLEKRVAAHQTGEIPGYTSTPRPVELVFSQDFPTREEALDAELRVKGWSRKKKEAMIRGDWKEVRRLAWGRRNPLPNRLK
jgi:putative endonuclease